MIRNVFAATAVAVMAGTTFAADFCFPSSAIPGGKKAADVKQYVSFIWDDNGYSGEVGTAYEYKTGEIDWKDRANVGGKDDNGTTKNPLKINEGGMGISWAVKTLGGKLKGGHMTFNMIAGLYVPTWGPQWYDRQSEYGSYNNGTVDDNGTHDWIVAAANGREQAIFSDKLNGTKVQKPYMIDAVKKIQTAKHELGNHTLDHIETNSPYPKTTFDKFGFGEGFDDGTSGTNALGETFDEANAYGTEGAALTMGWKDLAGKALSQKGWEGVIAGGEEPAKKYAATTTQYGFRAPRLEINSNLFFALKAKNYLYDCGLEEGYEENVDGTNFLWPYTTDNGTPNIWTQKENGEKIYIDSMPTGLWQYPVNVMIVPENLRDAVWANYNKMALATDEKEIESMEEFHKHGKVTGFDFNMFILYGMTGPNAQKTLEYSLDQRMKGNKAPMHIGCHTDYFTPIYDYATLLSEFNEKKYGLVISQKWNTWSDRKAAWEGFADYATKQGAIFASGKEVIDAIKGYMASETVGTAYPYTGMTWTFMDDESLSNQSVPSSSVVVGDLNNVSVKIPSGMENMPTFYTDESDVPGQFDGLTHISLDYETNTALSLQLFVEGDEPWEVLLNNVNKGVNSGKIPLSAFHYNQYSLGANTSIDLKKVTGIAIRPLTTGASELNAEFTVNNVKLYGANVATPIKNIATAKNSFVKMTGVNANTLNLNVATAGVYNVQIFTANGRLVRSVDNQNLSAGANNVKLNALPSGVYMMKISTQNKSQVLKAVVM